MLSDLSARWMEQPKQTSLTVQGVRVHGCYYPLLRGQLEWQISINDVTKQVEKEQAKIMQVECHFKTKYKRMLINDQ